MRNATILVVRLKGVATEAIKNIVLAGIGKLVVVDPEDVVEQDLGAGFFYRDEDVGKKVRVRWQCGRTGPRGGKGACTGGPRLLCDLSGPHSIRRVRCGAESLSGSQRRELQRRRGAPWGGRFSAALPGFPFMAGPSRVHYGEAAADGKHGLKACPGGNVPGASRCAVLSRSASLESGHCGAWAP